MFFGKNDKILSYKVLQKSNIFNQNLEKLKKTSSFFLHFTKLISVLIKTHNLIKKGIIIMKKLTLAISAIAAAFGAASAQADVSVSGSGSAAYLNDAASATKLVVESPNETN